MFSDKQVADLSGKLSPPHVKTRVQSGRQLSYIEGWHAIAEANRIFGFGAWDRETVEMRLVSEQPRKIGQAGRDGWSVTYIAKVKVHINDHITREGWGAGHGIDADKGLAHESAIKEAETDAMKRALMTFGNPFGLALYDKEQANVGEPDRSSAPPRDQTTPEAIARQEKARKQAFIKVRGAVSRADLEEVWAGFSEAFRRHLAGADFADLTKEYETLRETLPATAEKDAA